MPWLGPLNEQYAYNIGIRLLHSVVGENNLLTFPRYPNNRPRLLREGYFRRMLEGELTLMNSPASDISAAQSDLRHLSLVQTLKIRVRHIDLDCEGRSVSSSQEAFLRSLDRRLTEALIEHAGYPTISEKAARHIVLVFGATQNITDTESYLWWLINIPPCRLFINTETAEVCRERPESQDITTYRSHSYTDKMVRCRMMMWDIFQLQDGGESWTESNDTNEDRKIAGKIGEEALEAVRKRKERLIRRESKIQALRSMNSVRRKPVRKKSEESRG